MSQDFQQHWLSAYLDDELSGDERALVERRLEEDVDARQMLDDLKRVRGLVAALPAWSGSNFQFDMSRLSQSEMTDDDVDNSQSSHSQTDAMRDAAAAAVNEPAGEDPVESKIALHGMPMAAWRGALALAAGLLLLILCVPLYWQRDVGTLAGGSRPPDGYFSAPAGGVMGGTSEAATVEAATVEAATVEAAKVEAAKVEAAKVEAAKVEAAKVEAAGEQAASNTYELAARAPAPASSKPTMPFDAPAVPAAPAPPAPVIVPSDPRAIGGRGANAPPAPSRSSNMPSNAPEAPASRAMGGLGGASGSRAQSNASTTELAADSPGLQPPSPSSPLSSQLFMCAKSEAWSEAEVEQTLTQLLPQVAVNDAARGQTKLKSNLDDKDATAGKPTDKMLAKIPEPLNSQELLLRELPATAELSQWFTQIQSAQPLSPVHLSEQLMSEAKKVDQLAELALSNRMGREQPLRASPNAETRASSSINKLEFSSKSTKLEADQAADVEKHGRILLFVTASEAKRILSTLFPSKPSDLPEPSPADKKVIVILNQR